MSYIDNIINFLFILLINPNGYIAISEPGAFIWPINSNIKELKIKKFSDLGQYMQSYGEKNIITEQSFVSKLLMTWELFYINPSVIILKRKII